MALLSSAAVFSAAVVEAPPFFFSEQRKAAVSLFLRCSSNQRSSASVKIIELPLPLLQKKKILKTV